MSRGRHEQPSLETEERLKDKGYYVLRDDAIGPPSTNLQSRIQYAVDTDTVLLPEIVTEIWSDAFLTNVMVPVLRHIVGNMERQLEDLEDEIRTDMTLSPFNNQVYDRLSAQIIALSKVILILQEWRG